MDSSFRPNWPSWHKKPLSLTMEEIANPDSVIDAFFFNYDLLDVRVLLREWLFQSSNETQNNQQEFMMLHQEIEKLVEAVWIIFIDKRQLQFVTQP